MPDCTGLAYGTVIHLTKSKQIKVCHMTLELEEQLDFLMS